MNVASESAAPGTYPALVLNADYRPLSYYPLSLWNWQDAVKAVFLDRVNIVSEYDHAVHSPSFEMKLPSVVALKSYVRPALYPAFTRFNVFLRDRFTCVTLDLRGHGDSPVPPVVTIRSHTSSSLSRINAASMSVWVSGRISWGMLTFNETMGLPVILSPPFLFRKPHPQEDPISPAPGSLGNRTARSLQYRHAP